MRSPVRRLRRLVIKQVTNAKLVLQANKPQRSLSRRTLQGIERFIFHIFQMAVPVLDTTKKPLAPTTERRARLLLDKGKAAVFRRIPFTIILKREVPNPSIPDLRLKIDPGSKTTGMTIINQDSGEIVLAAEIEHRGQKVNPHLISAVLSAEDGEPEQPVIESLALTIDVDRKALCPLRLIAASRMFIPGRADSLASFQSRTSAWNWSGSIRN